MTAGEIHRQGFAAYPTWVPLDVRHYLDHTIAGAPFRVLARRAGCHASTILRQVRRNEKRRDDPLMDVALDRLAELASDPSLDKVKDELPMMADNQISEIPDERKVDLEARRILRRLSEPDAVLAVSPKMDKAVVVRELEGGRTVRTAVVDRPVAEAFAVKDWIELKGNNKIARYGITTAGRAALKRLLADQDAQREAEHGMAEAPSVFVAQHQEWEERSIKDEEKRSRRVRYNALENPMAAIARRRGKDGKPFLSDDLVAAGERLREDFELSQMGPRVTQNWDRFMTAGTRGGYHINGGLSGPDAARERVGRALADLGPGLGDVALRVCCFLEGMEQAEKRMGWAARSGKIVLKIALQRLARHYRELGESAGLIG